MSSQFESLKKTALSSLDKSPKGSIDEPVIPLLDHINSHSQYFTTSSCSGRIAVYRSPVLQLAAASYQDEDDGQFGIQAREAVEEKSGKLKSASGKGGGEWLFVTHEELHFERELEEEKVVQKLLGDEEWDLAGSNGATIGNDAEGLSGGGLVYFKFEPVVVHITCRNLPSALTLLHAALSSGFRNSGLILRQGALTKIESDRDQSVTFNLPQTQGSLERVNLAIRPSPSNLDIPIAIAIPSPKTPSSTSQGKTDSSQEKEVGTPDHEDLGANDTPSQFAPQCRYRYRLLVDPKYLQQIVYLANERMRFNFQKISKLTEAVRVALEPPSSQSNLRPSEDDDWEPREARKERKRREGLERQKRLREEDISGDLG